MMGLLSKCCCSPSSCRGIQLWARGNHFGFLLPSVSELIQTGRYGAGGGNTSTDRDNFSNAIVFMRLRTLLQITEFYRADGFFPTTPHEIYYSGYQGAAVFTTLHVNGTDVSSEISTSFSIDITVDVQTGYVQSLSWAWTYDNTGSDTHLSGAYSVSVDLTTGEVTETGDDTPPQYAFVYFDAILDAFETFTYGSGTDYVEWEYNPTFGGVGSGRYTLNDGAGWERNLYWSGSGLTSDLAQAAIRALEYVNQDLANHTSLDVETWNASGDYIGDRFQWNHYYRGLTSIELYVKIYGEDFPTESYTGDLLLWPRRLVYLDGEWDAMVYSYTYTNGLSNAIVATPGTYGKFYYGLFADMTAGGFDGTPTSISMLGYSCKVEILGDNRSFQAFQDLNIVNSGWFGYFGGTWFGADALANDREIADCTQPNHNHKLPGTHVFKPGDLIYDFGMGVIQNRTYWDGTECITIPYDPEWVGQYNPCYR